MENEKPNAISIASKLLELNILPWRRAIYILLLTLIPSYIYPNALVDIYSAKLSYDDHHNSKGVKLIDVKSILVQDRANYHKYKKIDIEDSKDLLFSENNRMKLLDKLDINISAEDENMIINTEPIVIVGISKKNIYIKIVDTNNTKTKWKAPKNLTMLDDGDDPMICPRLDEIDKACQDIGGRVPTIGELLAEIVKCKSRAKGKNEEYYKCYQEIGFVDSFNYEWHLASTKVEDNSSAIWTAYFYDATVQKTPSDECASLSCIVAE